MFGDLVIKGLVCVDTYKPKLKGKKSKEKW